MYEAVKRGTRLLCSAPAVAWSLGALAISPGVAVHDLHAAAKVNWGMFGSVLIGAIVLQGSIASGKQQQRKRLPVAKKRSLVWLRSGGLGAAICCCAYVANATSRSVWLVALACMWLTLSYLCHPLRTIPRFGEWLIAFPALTLLTISLYLLLANAWDPVIVWAAVLHALLCVAWLSHMQVRDVTFRQQRKRQRTTVTWVAQRFGVEQARHVPAGAFLLTAFAGTIAMQQVAHVFFLTVLCAMLGAIRSWNLAARHKRKRFRQQLLTILMTSAHGVFLSLWVAWT